MNDFLPTLLPLGVRVVRRYLIGILVARGVATAAQGETLVGSPAVQTIISLVLGGIATALVELATSLARRYGRPT